MNPSLLSIFSSFFSPGQTALAAKRGNEERSQGLNGLSSEDRITILGAFLAMESALDRYKHDWSDAERAAYEKAMGVLGILEEQ